MSASSVAGMTAVHHNAQLVFCFGKFVTIFNASPRPVGSLYTQDAFHFIGLPMCTGQTLYYVLVLV
jgi:hypothetical protein